MRLGCDANRVVVLACMLAIVKNLYWIKLEEIDQVNDAKLSIGTKDGDILSLLDLYNDFTAQKNNKGLLEWAKRNYVSI